MNSIAKNMRRISIGTLAVVVLLSLGACDGFLDINDNPNEASDTDITPNPELLFAPALVNLQSNRTIETAWTPYFVNTWAPLNALAEAQANYNINPLIRGNTWINQYTDVAKNTQLIIDATNEADPETAGYNPGNVRAQARIVQAYAYFYVTQFFGEVPATQANKPDEFPNPKADEQEEVLRFVIDLWDTAIDEADPSAGNAIQDEDLIFKGDMQKWIRLANSLKLRAYFLLDSGGADVTSEIDSLINNADLIRTNGQNALFPFFDQDGRKNNAFQLKENNGFEAWFGCGETVVEEMKNFASNINGLDADPRLQTYCNPAPASGDIVGLGTDEAPNTLPLQDFSPVGDAIQRATFPNRLITASEIWLRIAEWRARNGNLSDAQTALETGVQRSMDFFDGKPGEIPQPDKEAFIDGLPDLDNLSNPTEYIQLHQYVDYFERRPQGWTNWRRTKVPDIDPPPEARYDVIIRRWRRPPDVLSNNSNINNQIPGSRPMWFEGEN
jgi:hypothetical protein